MSCDGASSPSLPNEPEAVRPTPSARLLAVVHGLIALGTAWLGIVQRKDMRPAVRWAIARRFGTRNLALILARLQRGLALAAALEQRVVRQAERIDAAQPRLELPPLRTAVRSVSERKVRPTREELDAALLNAPPSAAEIARMVRVKPIGRVLQDICRDFGLAPADKGWFAIAEEVMRHGGSVKRLFDAFWTRNENATPATDEEVAEEVADIRAGGMTALNDPLVARDRLRPEDVREVGLGTGPPTGPPEFALAA